MEDYHQRMMRESEEYRKEFQDNADSCKEYVEPEKGFSIREQLRGQFNQYGQRMSRNERRLEEKRIRKLAKKEGIKL